MNALLIERQPALTLQAGTAEDLLSPDPVSIGERATVREAMALLTDRGFSAAPVIDDAGRPVGVVSRTDLLVHQREAINHPVIPEREAIPEGFEVEEVDGALVRDVMTPVVFCVDPGTPAAAVVKQLLGLKIHRLFVVDDGGVLTGVISTVDVLRHLE